MRFRFGKKIACAFSIILIFNTMIPVTFAADSTKNYTKDYVRENEFTARVNINIDKEIVKPGESFTMTLSMENISNADVTELTKVSWVFITATQQEIWDSVKENMSVSYDESNFSLKQKSTLVSFSKISDNEAYYITDFKASLKFDVSETAQATEFYLANAVNINSNSTDTRVYFDPITIKISNEETPADPPATETSYTVSAKPSAESVYEGDTFTVDVVASADQAADLAAVDAVLNYDKDLVKPTSAVVKNLENGTALYYTDGSNGVTDDSQGKVTTWGDKASLGDEGLVAATYTFEALKTGVAEFSIADGAKIGKTGSTAEISAASGAAAKVEIKEIPDEKILISNDEYKGAPNGKQVLKYIAKDMPAEGSAYFYGEDEQSLYYAGEDSDGRHIFMGFVDNALTNDTVGEVSEKSGLYITLSQDGDLNESGSVNAVDSLIAYDIASLVYVDDADMSKLSAKVRFEADINRDGKVDAADARAIMYKALGISEPVSDQQQ